MARAVPVFVLLLAFFTSACAGSAASYSNASGATKFLADTVGGARVGFDVEKVDNEMWHVTFEGNTSTTEGTAQTYGLYRCAIVALENGYDGFEILSDITLDDFDKTYGNLPGSSGSLTGGAAAGATGGAIVGGVRGGFAGGVVGGIAGGAAGTALIFVLTPGGVGAFPVFSSDIKLVRKPLSGEPPKMFDAAALKAALEPYVMGKKCEKGNVCAHERNYLRPPEN